MDVYEQAFRLLPDTVIITDVYWYILDFNHAAPFDTIKKGWSLTRVMPDCKTLPNDRLRCGDKIYQRSINPVYAQNLHVGYTVYLSDITDRESLIEQQRRKSEELEALTQRLAKANAELEAYVRQAEALSDYEEQRRIARAIHVASKHRAALHEQLVVRDEARTDVDDVDIVNHALGTRNGLEILALGNHGTGNASVVLVGDSTDEHM